MDEDKLQELTGELIGLLFDQTQDYAEYNGITDTSELCDLIISTSARMLLISLTLSERGDIELHSEYEGENVTLLAGLYHTEDLPIKGEDPITDNVDEHQERVLH